MTDLEKKERRQLRHKLQKAARRGTTLRFRAHATGKQMRSAAKAIANLVLSGKNSANVVSADGSEVKLESFFAPFE
jgi:hypothetical protein